MHPRPGRHRGLGRAAVPEFTPLGLGSQGLVGACALALLERLVCTPLHGYLLLCLLGVPKVTLRSGGHCWAWRT